jgi:SNF2 family DNA or RNA helicase
MSIAPLAGFTPARQLPNGELFHSDWGLLPYQIDGIAQTYIRTGKGDGGYMAVWDMGIGKTVLGIAASCYLFENDEIDQVIVVCERNKRHDWVAEFEKFSALSVMLYHGSGRQQRLAKKGAPHVLVTTYETGKIELMTRKKNPGKRGRGSATDGPLMEALGLRGKRIFWVFDESPKMRNRTSEIHKSFEYAINQLRRGPHRQRLLGLTGTPIERGYEDAYNLGRIFFPSIMPTVAEFERVFTMGEDFHGNLIFREERAHQFAAMFRKGIHRKKKTDADVAASFPEKIEESIFVEMESVEREFASAVLETAAEMTHGMEEELAASLIWTAMRVTAGHPAAHLHTKGQISKRIAAALGPDALRSIGSAKTKELIERLRPIVKGQGAQVLVFSFFPSVIREVARELRDAGFVVAEHHGQLSDAEIEEAKRAFKAGEVEILFSSDIGAKGLNLPEATYVIEYESALTYATRAQRIDRAHRIGSDKALVTGLTLVLHDTVEQNIFSGTIDRNAAQDLLLGDEEDGSAFISAETRREMLSAYRRKRK